MLPGLVKEDLDLMREAGISLSQEHLVRAWTSWGHKPSGSRYTRQTKDAMVLHVLRTCGPLIQKEITRRTGISYLSLRSSLGRLAGKGLVKKSKDTWARQEWTAESHA
jgi:hypothetical protein